MKIAVLTGAGISAESGIRTFRDGNGLWEEHDIKDVASPEGWNKNPALVLRFYNERRAAVRQALPNKAHLSLVQLAEKHDVTIITQNVDDLHERAGSKQIIHLHGELLKMRSSIDPTYIQPIEGNIQLGDVCPKGGQMRPHIVWFGEEVPEMERAVAVVRQAEVLIIVGTSMQVYPAAGLVNYLKRGTPIYFIDPKPAIPNRPNLTVLAQPATEGLPNVVAELLATTN